MIRKILAILFVLVCIGAAPALSATFYPDYRPYLTIGGGVSLLSEIDNELHSTLGEISVSSDPGFNAYIASGLAYDAGRIEFSLAYHNLDLDEFEDSLGAKTDLTGDAQVAAFHFSMFWDFNKDGMLSPYFGGGIGVAGIDFDDNLLQTGSSGGVFSYQLGAGVSFYINENTQLDLGYKLLGFVEPNLGPLDPDYMVLHSGNAGLRFLF